MSYRITKNGLEKLQEELKLYIEIKRPHIIEEIAIAKSHGDLRENAEYHSAKEEQRNIENRISYLEDFQKKAHVLDIDNIDNKVVIFGSKVKIVNSQNNKEIKFQILGQYEAEMENGVAIISDVSPMGSAVLGKKKEDIVVVKAPNGEINYTIVEIS